jgi:hypothetical protein
MSLIMASSFAKLLPTTSNDYTYLLLTVFFYFAFLSYKQPSGLRQSGDLIQFLNIWMLTHRSGTALKHLTKNMAASGPGNENAFKMLSVYF